MKNITKKLLLLTLIIILGASIVSATENNTNTPQENILENTNTETNTDTIQETNLKQEKNQVTTITNKNKTIKKEEEPKTIILNSSTFDTYVTNRTFNEKVNNGDTIDIQGILDGGRFSLDINKPLNIISSTHDAYIDVNTASRYNDYAFIISNGGSGSNVSDLTFHNTHIYTTNAQNITINNITADCNQSVGQGRGMISIRDGSRNVTIRNSYFETRENGGHSNVVFAYAHDCLFENNTVVGHGFVGNLVYITTYGSSEDTGETNVTYGNTNITIRNNYIDGSDATDSGICVGVVIEGANHTIVNNTILKTMSGMVQVNDYGTNTANNTFADNYCPITPVDMINITNKNYNDYGNINNKIYYLNENITNKNVILNLTLAEEIYSEHKFNLIAINTYNYTIKQITLNHTNITINDVYTPQTTYNLLQDATITNSTIKKLNLHNTKSNITNNIIINQDNTTNNNPTTINIDQTNNETIIENNYLLAYNTQTAQSGENTINIQNNNGGKIQNNTPNYNNIHILNTTTYNTIFNENNTLKDEITGTIIVTENITQPLTINKAINITTQKTPDKDKKIYDADVHNTIPGVGLIAFAEIPRTIPTFTNITFTQEAQNSNLTNSHINNIIINADEIKIENNTITGNITINTDNNNITNNNITNNQTYTINLKETSANNTIQNNILNATYKGDLSISNTQNNNVQNNTPLTDVQIALTIPSQIVPGTTPLKINITANNESVKNGYVVVLFNGTQVAKENLTNGYLETNITPSKFGNNTLKVYYFGDKPYNNTSAAKTIEVIKANATVTLESESNLTIGETITIKATVQSPQINQINNQTITFKINNTEHNTTITNNEATITLKTNDTFTNGIYATLDQLLFNSAQSNTIKLEKGEANIKATQKITDNNITITAYITDTGNTPLSYGYIRYKNGTKTLRNIPITNGIAQYSIPITEGIEGTVITLNLTNNNAINNKVEYITLTLTPPTITNTKIEEINGKTGQPTTITATVTTEDGQPINEGTITFTTNEYTQTIQVTNSTATTTHTFTQTLNDTLTATYTPADNTAYYESTNTTTITITKDPINVTINIEAINAYTNEIATITATVTTEDGQPINEGTITFTTNEYTQTIQVTNSTATTTHTFTQTLNDTLTITYTPENLDDYNPQNTTTTITITEKTTEYTLKIDTTEFTIASTATIQASIYENNQIATNINGGKIVFKINGKSLKNENGKVIYAKVTNGTAKIENYTIPTSWDKENITIEAVYSGSSQCTSLRTNKTTLTINKTLPSISTENITTTIGSTITLTATVTDNDKIINTGKVVFKINGKTVKDANGKVIYAKVVNNTVTVEYTINTNYKIKDYTITALYISSDYDRLEDTKTLKITA